MKKICINCDKEYDASDKNNIAKKQKYCSKYCREHYWRKTHVERCKQFNQKHRLSKPILCRYCKEPIPNEKRKSGRVYCSEECITQSRSRSEKEFREKCSAAFIQHKENIGCQHCGYNKYGGSLDFHHARDKKFRINAKGWHFNSEKTKAEIEKCILLCKNCHYELHHKQRQVTR